MSARTHTHAHPQAHPQTHGLGDVDPGLLTTPAGRTFVRRSFMKWAFTGAGAAAFATMQATAAQAATTPSAAPSGAPTGGDAGGGAGASGGITEEFVGLTTDGTVVPDLYSVHSTGVSTTGVVTAATAFLGTLSAAQKTSVVFDIDPADYTQDEFRLWSNIHSYDRQGLQVADLTAVQQRAVLAVLGAGLSAKGLTLTQNVRRINGIAGVELKQTDQFSEGRYYISLLGTPSATEPWGFQFEGHHLVINYFVLGDQVVMTPTFLGSEPNTASSAAYGTITVLDEEIEQAITTINTLTAAERATAVLSATKTGDDNVAEAFKDDVQVPFVGIRVSQLSAAAQAQVMELVWLFVHHQKGDHADVRMAEVTAHLDTLHFAWKGPTDADAVFWFRLHSDVFYLEFDCETPGPVGQGYGDPQVPSRRHLHAVMRTPNGNDYGKALLALHLATSEHHT